MRLAELDLGGHGENGSKQNAVRHRETNRPDLELTLLPCLFDVVADGRIRRLVVNVVEDVNTKQEKQILVAEDEHEKKTYTKQDRHRCPPHRRARRQIERSRSPLPQQRSLRPIHMPVLRGSRTEARRAKAGVVRIEGVAPGRLTTAIGIPSLDRPAVMHNIYCQTQRGTGKDMPAKVDSNRGRCV